jgi:hypothetical protein
MLDSRDLTGGNGMDIQDGLCIGLIMGVAAMLIAWGVGRKRYL